MKAKAEVTDVREKLADARLSDASSPFGGTGFGDMQENLQRIFGQMFGDNVQVQGFGMNPKDPDAEDLEDMLGGPLQDLSKVQVGDAVRETKR